MTAPKRIWAVPCPQHEPEHPWMHATCSDCIGGDVGAEYVRADIVLELVNLIRDAIEDENEFETEWDKCARAALAKLQEDT